MYIFKFADIGEGIHEGKVGEIVVKEGQTVKDGDNLFIVETDKITTEITSPADGVIAKILIKEGETISVGQEIFHIDDSAATTAAQAAPVPQQEPVIETPKVEEPVAQTVVANVAEPQVDEKPQEQKETTGSSVVGEVKVSNDLMPSYGDQIQSGELNASATIPASSSSNESLSSRVLISPLARLIARDNGVNLENVKGSGPLGRILKVDVEKYINKKNGVVSSTTASTQEKTVSSIPTVSAKSISHVGLSQDEIWEISTIRKTIAATLKKSVDSVAYTNLTAEIDVTDLWNFRNNNKDLFLKKYDVKLTLLPFIFKAISFALQAHPLFNAIFDEQKNAIIKKKNINIGLAVDTKDGLIVPCVKNVDTLSIFEIAKEISELATKARDKKLKINELQDCSFSVTNYGSLGIDFGTPIIKYPELAIAGIGTLKTIHKKVDQHFVERNVFYLTVAADHRWIDGADIARFIKEIKTYLENPLLMNL